MIGKFYRPTSVKNYVGKRGFQLSHKYKSNFGGMVDFVQGIYLDYDFSTKSEEIKIEIANLNALVDFTQESYKEKPEIEYNKEQKKITIIFGPEDTVPLKKQSMRIMHLRKLYKPTSIKVVNGAIQIVFPIISIGEHNEEDALTLTFRNIVREGREIVVIKAICDTPVRLMGVQLVNSSSQEGDA